VDLSLIYLLIDVAAQHAPPPVKLTAIAGLTALEVILISTVGTMGGVVGIVWKWGNGMRKEAAVLLEARTATITKLVTDQTADNKDIIHALQNVDKSLGQLVAKVDK